MNNNDAQQFIPADALKRAAEFVRSASTATEESMP